LNNPLHVSIPEVQSQTSSRPYGGTVDGKEVYTPKATEAPLQKDELGGSGYPDSQPRKMILGLKRWLFYLLLLVLIAAIVGAVLGGVLGSKAAG